MMTLAHIEARYQSVLDGKERKDVVIAEFTDELEMQKHNRTRKGMYLDAQANRLSVSDPVEWFALMTADFDRTIPKLETYLSLMLQGEGVPALDRAMNEGNLVIRKPDGLYWLVGGLEPLVIFLKTEELHFTAQFILKYVRKHDGTNLSAKYVENVKKIQI